jgi:dienelactone hydrolase
MYWIYRSMAMFGVVMGWVLPLVLWAQSTPMDQSLEEGRDITIACELKEAPSYKDVPVLDSSDSAKKLPGLYHYKLRLPDGYLADPAKKWPCIFIMSPGGNAGIPPGMAGALKARGFVAVMLMEAKNGPWEPIVGNFLAAHDDVTQRVRVAEGKKFATGFSGGARASSVFVQIRPGFAGLILQGAGLSFADGGSYHTKGIKKQDDLYVLLFMGRTDSNHVEIAKVEDALPKARFKCVEFDGGHQGPPQAVFEEGFAWLMEKVPLGP